MIPEFTELGLLPKGIHEASFEEFESRFSFSVRRKQLIVGLKLAMVHLKEMGCEAIFIDGSFVTSKYRPGDFDAAWSVDGLDFEEAIQIHPVFGDFSNERKNQKAIYGGEFFPAQFTESSSGEPFLTFFQETKDNLPKGIVKLRI